MDYTLPTPIIVLHVYPGQWNLPSFDPLCAAALLCLQLAIPGQFSLRTCSDPDSSPTGQLPFLVHEQQIVTSFSSIIRYVAGLRSADNAFANADLDSHLSPSERSQRNAWFSHVESHLGDLVYHTLYANDENWTKLTNPSLASMFPIPQKYYVPQRIRTTYYPRLLAAGLWREHVEEKPVEKVSLRDKFESKKQKLGKHPAMSRAFEREKAIVPRCSNCLSYTGLVGTTTARPALEGFNYQFIPYSGGSCATIVRPSLQDGKANAYRYLETSVSLVASAVLAKTPESLALGSLAAYLFIVSRSYEIRFMAPGEEDEEEDAELEEEEGDEEDEY